MWRGITFFDCELGADVMTAAYWGKIRKIAFKFQFELARHRRYPDCGMSADDTIGCLGLRAREQVAGFAPK
jgi:hypothetical protein